MPFNKGRHFAGTPVGGNRTKPPQRTGSASGNFVGGGMNNKSAASPEHSPSVASTDRKAGDQLDSIVNQSPEPFRNPKFGAVPNLPKPMQSGDGVGRGGAYKPFKGSRVSVSDGFKNVNPASASKNIAPAGIQGGVGAGREQGKVAGPSQPRKSGSPHFQGGMAQSKAKKPSFYGR